jgi:formyltetrahydrofolate deformylase
MHAARYYTLTASCPDQVGIIARVTGFIAEHGWLDPRIALPSRAGAGLDGFRLYFMRIEVKADSLPFHLAEFRSRFQPLADDLQLDWRINDSAVKKRVVVLVSKQEHCLYDLLARWQSKELDIEIACVISNHDSFKGFVEWHGIPFHHVPVTGGQQGRRLCRGAAPVRGSARRHHGAGALHADPLARAMRRLSGRILNIHHSFLPSFVGAKPYHQAYTRGVKLIGATCHYVTADLDQGPIIEQDVIRIDHSDSVEDMVRYGKDIEKTVLARGLRYHLEDRVLVHGNKTVVFR